MSDMNPIVEKIRKLQALAERAGTQEEAALAAARVQELLFRHNLDLGETLLREDPGGIAQAGKCVANVPAYAGFLAEACEVLFDVRSLLQKSRYDGNTSHTGICWAVDYGLRVAFIGLRANVQAACVTYEYLIESIEALLRGAKSQGLVHGTGSWQAFRRGAAVGILGIVHQQKQHVVDHAGYAQIVHVGRAVANRLYSQLKLGRPRRLRDDLGFGRSAGALDAYDEGLAQSSRIDIHGARSGRMIK